MLVPVSVVEWGMKEVSYAQWHWMCKQQCSSVPNSPGTRQGMAGKIPRGRDRQDGTVPLAVVRCRANYSRDCRARPELPGGL